MTCQLDNYSDDILYTLYTYYSPSFFNGKTPRNQNLTLELLVAFYLVVCNFCPNFLWCWFPQTNIEERERFFREFGSAATEDDNDDGKTSKPSDYKALFGGNNNDHFMFGVKFTRYGFFVCLFQTDFLLKKNDVEAMCGTSYAFYFSISSFFIHCQCSLCVCVYIYSFHYLFIDIL